ncbi:MAG: metallophosphoesterase [Labilithrix sp.]|nr:metallophosphoesterase [Labilithrix sp.]
MRTIIVGDVHGCRAELEALLDRVAFSSGDRLIFVGDLVARGPDSLGVLDVVRRTGAIVVRGNHEQKLIDWRDARHAWLRGEAAAKPPIGRMHRDLARSLRPIDWALLETSPYYVELPEHGLVVVHAGVLPGVAIDAQPPATLMRLRTVRVRSKRGRKGEHVLWGSCYAGPPQIVFGHNAAPGLQLHAWATGLDTGCVYGGRLTAMVLGEAQKVPRTLALRRELLVSQPADRVWFVPASKRSDTLTE